MRFFNTTGPVVAADHYCIPPLQRVSLEEVLALIRDKRYFVLHAPRQTGKTSTLLALRDLLNGGSKGAYRCVYVNVESAQTAREHVERGMRAILGALGTRARRTLGDDSLARLWPDVLTTFGPDGALHEVLVRWAEADPAPLVLLIDEIDTLIGDTLLVQHTAETGQRFAEAALQAVWELTAGQPWMVNGLAQEACFADPAGRDRSRAITAETIHAARERIILRRETHLVQLTDKLQEERVAGDRTAAEWG